MIPRLVLCAHAVDNIEDASEIKSEVHIATCIYREHLSHTLNVIQN